MALSAPLRWIGPYPAVALSFPALASPAQKARLLTNPNQAANLGVTLDFVIDTAANTNTISAQVAGPTGAGGLELQQILCVALGRRRRIPFSRGHGRRPLCHVGKFRLSAEGPLWLEPDRQALRFARRRP